MNLLCWEGATGEDRTRIRLRYLGLEVKAEEKRDTSTTIIINVSLCPDACSAARYAAEL